MAGTALVRLKYRPMRPVAVNTVSAAVCVLAGNVTSQDSGSSNLVKPQFSQNQLLKAPACIFVRH
jgi:hypothetical protein